MYRIRILAFILSLFLLATVVSAQEDIIFEGSLDDSTPVETFSIRLEAGQFAQITTNAADELDTVLTIYDPAGDVVGTNDDYGVGFNSQVLITAFEAGEYSIEVARFDDSTNGDYTVTVAFTLDAALGLSADAVVLVNTVITLDAASNSVKQTLTLDADSILVIRTLAQTPDLDTTLQLLDEGGTPLAENDDRGDGSLNSEIIYQIPESGQYTVIVGRFDDEVDGSTLLVAAIDPSAEVPFNYSAVEGEFVGTYTGFLDPTTEDFIYPFDLAAGDSLYAYTQVTNGDLDTQLELTGPDGFLVATNDDRGDGTLNSALAFTAEAAGTYSLSVGRYSGNDSSGDFEVTIQLVDMATAEEINLRAEGVVELSGPVEILETPNFRIHYTLSGGDAATAEYIQEVAETLETIFDIQVNQIGWAAPPRNDDGLYDTYVIDVLGRESGILGYARRTRFVGDNPNTPERETRATRGALVIDNDYRDSGIPNPLSLMRATTTHEFNHIIQFGYDTEEGLDWLYESTAVWTETVTVGDEQDGTGYVAESFTYPELCFGTLEMDGDLAYGDWTFQESLADVYGENFIPQIWQSAVVNDGLDTLIEPLSAVGDTLENAVLRWRIQNYALDFDLAPLFDATVWEENRIDSAGEWTFTGNGIQEMGANYFTFDLNGVYEIALDGDDALEIWALGVTDSTVEAFPLEATGVFDSRPFEHAAIMVFNTTPPTDFLACTYTDYSLTVEPVTTEPTTQEPVFTFSAEEFSPLSSAG